jgi:hypothetical protein
MAADQNRRQIENLEIFNRWDDPEHSAPTPVRPPRQSPEWRRQAISPVFLGLLPEGHRLMGQMHFTSGTSGGAITLVFCRMKSDLLTSGAAAFYPAEIADDFPFLRRHGLHGEAGILHSTISFKRLSSLMSSSETGSHIDQRADINAIPCINIRS